MNYGHHLRFGVRLASTALLDPGRVTRWSRRVEELGLDLVVVADRPDTAPGEAWTVLSWMAGVTDRVELSAILDAGPGRNPAVLARAAATLDHLSGGRVRLGLDAVPQGGHDGVAALGEAVDVVRELWNVLDRGLARSSGQTFRVAGAQKGAPAHRIPITLRGRGRELLDLVGRVADEWLLDADDVASLGEDTRVVDEAARAAGRDPAEIRRSITLGTGDDGPVPTAGSLLPLVVEHGIGTVVLDPGPALDDDALTRFAEQLVPALRAAADVALPPRWSRSAVTRPAAVRARRRPGIDYDGAPAGLAEIVEPGDLAYAGLQSGYLRGGSPGLVLRAATTDQVVSALAFARRHPDLPLSRRSAGHGISGRSTNDGGIVIDVSLMNRIEVLDERSRRVRIGPGARWADVARALEPYGWALSSGDYGGVGVGGLATAGGIGYLVREHGLTIDHLREVEMVLADGSVVRANDRENADLFWAVRGAGANFGIVTAFEFEVDDVGPVAFAELVQDAGDLEHYLVDWGRVVEESPRDLTSFLIVPPPRGRRPAVALTRTLVDAADEDTVLARLQPLAAISPMYDQKVVLTSYAAVMDNASPDAPTSRGEPVSRSGLLAHVSPEFAAAAARVLRGGAVHWFQLRSVGGAVADVAPDDTAYPHRTANFSLVVMGGDDHAVDRAWAELAPFVEGLYLSFESSLRPGRIDDAWPARTLSRLRSLKATHDPDGVFDDNFDLSPIPDLQEQRP